MDGKLKINIFFLIKYKGIGQGNSFIAKTNVA